MTPHPQQEYIITEDQLNFLLDSKGSPIKKAIRSRPASSPPAAPSPATCTAEVCRTVINAHREEAAEYSRNQTLGETISILEEYWREGRPTNNGASLTTKACFAAEMQRKINSLRTPSTQEQAP